jgi:predicted amidophosphoribosyltransferase
MTEEKDELCGHCHLRQKTKHSGYCKECGDELAESYL